MNCSLKMFATFFCDKNKLYFCRRKNESCLLNIPRFAMNRYVFCLLVLFVTFVCNGNAQTLVDAPVPEAVVVDKSGEATAEAAAE